MSYFKVSKDLVEFFSGLFVPLREATVQTSLYLFYPHYTNPLFYQHVTNCLLQENWKKATTGFSLRTFCGFTFLSVYLFYLNNVATDQFYFY